MGKAVYQRQDDYDADVIAGMAAHVRALLAALGEDPDRGALVDTPTRVAKALAFLTHGMHQDPQAILASAVFEEAYNETVLVKDIELFSMCEHHMLPFFGKAHVAYVPDGRIVGLSKIPRVVDAFARRLQVQERLTVQIRDAIDAALRPQGVAVIIQAQHLCMQMRGVEKQHSMTTTSAYTGVFRDDLKAREAFIKLAIG
ncbi:MAG: GTP cyclohydrolase I FolE [Myxococcales bacterium]|nr:GTP cyclohydrolase I FolE [Myxococcales bacterium]MCB9524078.1 GTP cyclohydrolase I FolE [Myxococcales bacterium]